MKTCISAPAHPFATGGRVSGLVLFFFGVHAVGFKVLPFQDYDGLFNETHRVFLRLNITKLNLTKLKMDRVVY